MPLLLFLVVAPTAVLVVSRVHDQLRPRVLVVLWLTASGLLGYAAYRAHCAQPLTCDVGGTSRFFLHGNPYYFVHHVPQFTAATLVALAVAFLVIRLQDRSRSVGVGSWAVVPLATLGAVMMWILVAATVSSMWPA